MQLFTCTCIPTTSSFLKMSESGTSSEEKMIILADKEKSVSETVKKENFPQVENVKWVINVTTATDEKQDIMEPHALVRLHLQDQVTKTKSIATLDLNEKECVKFYELLENIQEKLDDLYKEKNPD